MASSLLISLFSLLSLLNLSSSSTSPETITLSLTPLTKNHKTINNPWEKINHLASASLTRAHHLKHYPNNTASLITKTPLFPRGYGGYSIALSFGTPPQLLSFVMDTGSSLVWFPCTKNYLCTNCNFPNTNPNNISAFMPKLSSSVKVLGCSNPKCRWIFGPDALSSCKDCHPGNCTKACPVYIIQYGSGATSGILLLEKLNFPNQVVKDFVVGCSILSTRQPSGIAGFGRGPESLPAQMGLRRFSYCLLSHQFDDTLKSSEMVLIGGSNSGDVKTEGVSYTKFRKNPFAKNPAFQDYYYVTLRKITVGGRKVRVPYSFLVPGTDGNGGTIIDSGTTFTFMDKEVFESVAGEFERQMANYSRATDVENLSALRPCFDLAGEKFVIFPELIFHFKGGAKMVLPLADYFSFLGNSGFVCMTIVSNNVTTPGGKVGPSIVIGNYQQQNFYIEYDLENQRLGFRKQICK